MFVFIFTHVTSYFFVLLCNQLARGHKTIKIVYRKVLYTTACGDIEYITSLCEDIEDIT